MKKMVMITWVSLEDGGRKPPPMGTRYTPIIEIQGMDSLWSSDFVCTETNDNTMLAEIGFLSDSAPFELLQKNITFKLYEGRKLVATGIVLN